MQSIMPFVVIVFVILGIIASGIRIAQEYQRAVVFRLGRFTGIKGPGIYFLIPLIDRQQKIDTRTATVNLEQQETITKDSVTIKVNAVLWFRIVEASKAILEVVNYEQAVYQFSVTALRNIIGQHSLDEVLKGREQINQTLQSIVDATTEPWGIKIEMVEMKDVEIPESMQRAMARDQRLSAKNGPGSSKPRPSSRPRSNSPKVQSRWKRARSHSNSAGCRCFPRSASTIIRQRSC